MSPIDILGSLLGGAGNSGSGGGQSGGGQTGGLGGKILTELLKGGRGKATTSPPPRTTSPKTTSQQPTGSSTGSGAAFGRSSSLEQQAEDLEAMLGVARDRATTRQSGSATPSSAQLAPQSEYRRAPSPTINQRSPAPTSAPTPTSAPARQNTPNNPIEFGAATSMTQEDEAIVLIRTMVNAAKADGRVTQAEQQKILEQLASPSPEAVNFLRNEFAVPLDVREFAWSVPLGMEVQVYTLSLATIELDTNLEADYLRKLAHGLRLSPDACNQIHQRYGAPTIF